VTGFSVTYLTEQVVTVTYLVSTFGTYISRWLDKARIGGCSHLLVVAREHRGLYPPFCIQIIRELEHPLGCRPKIGGRSLLSVASGKQRKLFLPMNVILKDK
jgi:hypothetical protein